MHNESVVVITIHKTSCLIYNDHPRYKTGLHGQVVEKDVKSRWVAAFEGFKSFGCDELTAKHFRCSKPPDVDGIKIFDKDDQGMQC